MKKATPTREPSTRPKSTPSKRPLPATPVSLRTTRSKSRYVQSDSDSESEVEERPTKRTKLDAPPDRTPTKIQNRQQLPTPDPTPRPKARLTIETRKTRQSASVSLPSPLLSRASTSTLEPAEDLPSEAETDPIEDSDEEEESPIVALCADSSSADVEPIESFPAHLLQPFTTQILSTLRGHAQPYLPALPIVTSSSKKKAPKPKANSDLARQPYLVGLQVYERDLRATLDRTVTEGEGNCLLLVGPRGVGKTAVSFLVTLPCLYSSVADRQANSTSSTRSPRAEQLSNGQP
jgi:hypothetical protein